MRRAGSLSALTLTLGVALWALPVEAWAAGDATQDPAQLVARAFANLYADDYVQTMELTTRAPSVRPITRTLQITRKQSERPGKALVRFLAPFDVRRTSILILENDDANDDLYVYLPALRMTRRLSAAQRADKFFGTDLSYEDVEPKRADDYVARVLVRDGAAEEACLPVELRATDGFESTYERMVACIEVERAVIHWMDFHRHGRRVKRLEIDLAAIEEIQGRHIPFLMNMRTLGTGSETQVRTLEYDLTGDIPENLFTTWNLEAGDAARDRSRVGETKPE